MGEIELVPKGLLIFLMDAVRNHPLLPSHERALWKNLAADEVTHGFSIFFCIGLCLFILLEIAVIFVFVYLFFNGFYCLCVEIWENTPEFRRYACKPSTRLNSMCYVEFRRICLSGVWCKSGIP